MAGSCPTAITLAATLFGQLPLSLAEHGIVVMNWGWPIGRQPSQTSARTSSLISSRGSPPRETSHLVRLKEITFEPGLRAVSRETTVLRTWHSLVCQPVASRFWGEKDKIGAIESTLFAWDWRFESNDVYVFSIIYIFLLLCRSLVLIPLVLWFSSDFEMLQSRRD